MLIAVTINCTFRPDSSTPSAVLTLLYIYVELLVQHKSYKSRHLAKLSSTLLNIDTRVEWLECIQVYMMLWASANLREAVSSLSKWQFPPKIRESLLIKTGMYLWHD